MEKIHYFLGPLLITCRRHSGSSSRLIRLCQPGGAHDLDVQALTLGSEYMRSTCSKLRPADSYRKKYTMAVAKRLVPTKTKPKRYEMPALARGVKKANRTGNQQYPNGSVSRRGSLEGIARLTIAAPICTYSQ